MHDIVCTLYTSIHVVVHVSSSLSLSPQVGLPVHRDIPVSGDHSSHLSLSPDQPLPPHSSQYARITHTLTHTHLHTHARTHGHTHTPLTCITSKCIRRPHFLAVSVVVLLHVSERVCVGIRCDVCLSWKAKASAAICVHLNVSVLQDGNCNSAGPRDGASSTSKKKATAAPPPLNYIVRECVVASISYMYMYML